MKKDFETPLYNEALQEAADRLKKQQPISQDIIEKAIGTWPRCADTPDTDSFVECYCAMPAYLEAENAFIRAAKQLASK